MPLKVIKPDIRSKINNQKLCVLCRNDHDRLFEVRYLDIQDHFQESFSYLEQLCKNEHVDLGYIKTIIESNPQFSQLDGDFKYCHILDSAYLDVVVSNPSAINEIAVKINNLNNQNYNNGNDNLKNEVNRYKLSLLKKYEIWVNAYNISKAYILAENDPKIKVYSHRYRGWFKASYSLTNNFHVRVQTNFGFGTSSYFFVIITYKDLEITPFSEWVSYQYAKFHDIIRYTRTYELKNEFWFDALNFCAEACNVLLRSEINFVENYILDECEKMVSGLERLLYQNKFTFKNRAGKTEEITFESHYLVEFRGEKISGALDFIIKIRQFDAICSTISFIKRIEKCSLYIDPVLADEIVLVDKSIKICIIEREKFLPEYNKAIEDYDSYSDMLQIIKQEINGRIQTQGVDIESLAMEQLKKDFPEYVAFYDYYTKVLERMNDLNKNIKMLNRVLLNLSGYKSKISSYFGAKKP
jgi:hypothetical protein